MSGGIVRGLLKLTTHDHGNCVACDEIAQECAAFQAALTEAQQTERDRLLDEFSAALKERGVVGQRQVYPFGDALDGLTALLQRRVEALAKAIAGLYDEIAHGNEEHRSWLKMEIEGYFQAALRGGETDDPEYTRNLPDS